MRSDALELRFFTRCSKCCRQVILAFLVSRLAMDDIFCMDSIIDSARLGWWRLLDIGCICGHRAQSIRKA